jgi:hypothetical protein
VTVGTVLQHTISILSVVNRHDRTHDVFETVFAVRSTGPILREPVSRKTVHTGNRALTRRSRQHP